MGERARDLSKVVDGARNRLLRMRLRLRMASPGSKGQSRPSIGLIGPRWLEEWLSPDAFVLTPERATSDDPPQLVLVATEEGALRVSAIGAGLPWGDAATVGYRNHVEPAIDPKPFLQPALANPLRVPTQLALPDDFEALASSATRPAGAPPLRKGASSSLVGEWLALTADAQEPYRRAHRRTVRDVLGEIFDLAGIPMVPTDDEVTVVCVTNRPHNLGQVLGNFLRQTHARRRLLLVTNSAGFANVPVKEMLEQIPDSTWLDVPEEVSLGQCLNMALDRCTTRYLAKFDDDDHYGAEYLGDMMIAHHYADAGVVGKHSYLAYVEELDRTVVRFPRREFFYTSYVAGGTLVIDTDRVGHVRFPDQSVGEDTAFLRGCQRAGYRVFAADRFNYLQFRGQANTWALSIDDYLADAFDQGTGRNLDAVEV